MKKLALVKVWSLAMCIAAAGVAPVANATVRFTYESGPLTWLASVVNDQVFFDDGSSDTPFFSISFDAPDSWLTPGKRTEFSIPEPTVRIWNERRPYTLSSEFYAPATIVIDPDGSVSDWVLGYQVSPIFGANDSPSVIAENKHYEVYSAGTGSFCACDHFDIVTNYVGQGPNPVVGEMYKIYTADNLNGPYWSVTQIADTPPISAVPEPASYGMMLGGLALFGVMGWRKRAASSRPMERRLGEALRR